jgi:hypothetical protein
MIRACAGRQFDVKSWCKTHSSKPQGVQSGEATSGDPLILGHSPGISPALRHFVFAANTSVFDPHCVLAASIKTSQTSALSDGGL